MGEIGVIVPLVAVAGMRTGVGMGREAEIKAGEVERRSNGQQQDQAKSKPLPQRMPPMPLNPVHGGSLGKAAGLRHP